MLLAQVAALLERGRIPFALIGAGALAVHGVSRSTLDQDLLVVDVRVLSADMWTSLPDMVNVDIRRGDAEDPLAGVVRLTMEGERDVDIVVGRHAFQAAALSRAVRVSTPEGELPVVDAADLILLKLYAGGLQDLWDIRQLLAFQTGTTLTMNVEERLAPLPSRCAVLWNQAKSVD